MLRRHALRLRAALMLLDAVMTALLLVVLSLIRFGADWSIYWRYITPEPVVLPLIAGTGWVAILAYFGLYRPRARWSIRTDAVDVAKSTLVLAAITLSLFFLFRLPDVSRLFLLGFFPALAATTLAIRSCSGSSSGLCAGPGGTSASSSWSARVRGPRCSRPRSRPIASSA
jgi:FlaA1/EpsC-like NDP-sugar epimerase